MKLFVNQNKREGEAFPAGAFISFGKMLDTRPGGYTLNGFYIKIEIPFLRKYGKYVDPNTFNVEQGYLRKVFLIRSRRQRGEGKPHWSFAAHWVSVDVL